MQSPHPFSDSSVRLQNWGRRKQFPAKEVPHIFENPKKSKLFPLPSLPPFLPNWTKPWGSLARIPKQGGENRYLFGYLFSSWGSFWATPLWKKKKKKSWVASIFRAVIFLEEEVLRRVKLRRYSTSKERNESVIRRGNWDSFLLRERQKSLRFICLYCNKISRTSNFDLDDSISPQCIVRVPYRIMSEWVTGMVFDGCRSQMSQLPFWVACLVACLVLAGAQKHVVSGRRSQNQQITFGPPPSQFCSSSKGNRERERLSSGFIRKKHAQNLSSSLHLSRDFKLFFAYRITAQRSMRKVYKYYVNLYLMWTPVLYS